MATGALACLRRRGIDVPGQVSVSGLNDLRFGAYASPPLSTIDVPAQTTGETAMQLMLDMLNHPDEAPPEFVLSHRLIARESITRAPAAATGLAS